MTKRYTVGGDAKNYYKVWEVTGPDIEGLEITSDITGYLTPVVNGVEYDASLLEDLGFIATRIWALGNNPTGWLSRASCRIISIGGKGTFGGPP